jgi:hypothetical protein
VLTSFPVIFIIATITVSTEYRPHLYCHNNCVVLSIFTQTPSTWPTVNFGIEVIIILNINCILIKPLSHGVSLTIFICYRLTWWPNTHLGCFKLYNEYYMSFSQKKPPIFISWYPSFPNKILYIHLLNGCIVYWRTHTFNTLCKKKKRIRGF